MHACLSIYRAYTASALPAPLLHYVPYNRALLPAFPIANTGALAVDPGNKRLADNELRNDRQAPAAGGLNPMAPGVPTGLPGAGGVPLLPAGLNNNPAGAPVNNTAAPAGTVHFAANGGPLQTPIAPPFNQPMQVQPNHMQMLQMLQMMLAQVRDKIANAPFSQKSRNQPIHTVLCLCRRKDTTLTRTSKLLRFSPLLTLRYVMS
jgi:hypothetical protein